MNDFVTWFRAAAPYIHAFRGRTFVVAFGGEVVDDEHFVELVHDINVLHSLGIRLVLVHGARPQIEAALAARGIVSRYHRGLRITDRATLDCVLESQGKVRAEIEAKLSMSLPNSPMAGARIDVTGGNFVVARPAGVIDGVAMLHTGEVRAIDSAAIKQRLDDGAIVLVSSVGYSPTGEIFNLTLEDVATHTAVALTSQKLVFLMDTEGVVDSEGKLITELTTTEAQALLDSGSPISDDTRFYLPKAVSACKGGVARAHLISRHGNGALLMELFTRDGVGTMVAQQGLDSLRPASIADIGGLLALIEPLEAQGVLVRRPRELLEREVERFVVAEHDGAIIGCAALYPFPNAASGELACLAVHPDFRRDGYGEAIAVEIEQRAKAAGLRRLFVLTTKSAHWFVERGFVKASVDDLPEEKQALYNYQRKSEVLVKQLG
ncbi:MAG: amino-acid N-acetyltransferase [Betaproteobacteria bacterium]|nr:amino-acid N-acetyltransferase [Betaproteobacteria bacterium]